MKKWLIILLLVVIMLPFTALAQSPSLIKKAVTVDGKTRTALIWVDKEGLHIQYHSDDSHGMVILGEEIFKNGEKVFDNYRENDGLRPIN